MLPVAAAIPDPTMTPAVWAIASTPPTTPRSLVGTWSGTVAVIAASIALRDACASAHASTSRHTESAPESSSIATAPPTAPPSTHGSRRPNRSVVRSEKAPHTGLSTVETRAPTPVTSDSTPALWSGEIASDCCASSTWMGPKKPDHRPMLASTSQVTQSRETFSVGSRSDAVDRLGGAAHAGPGRVARWARMTSAYQSKDRFGVRTWVSKSTCTSPNRWVKPCAHSKLSISDQQ